MAAEDGPLVLGDMRVEDIVNPVLLASGVRSLVGVPLPIGAGRGVIHVGTLASRRFGEDDVRLLQRVADLVGTALAQMRSVATTRRIRANAEASSLLETARDEDATLQGVARLAVPDLADFCIVHAVGYDGHIRRAAIAHTNDGQEPMLLKATDGFELVADTGTGPLAEVIRTGRVLLIPAVDEDVLRGFVMDAEGQRHLTDLGPQWAIVVPLIARSRTVGAMTCVATDSTSRYTHVEVALAQGLARHAALAIDNARLFQEARSAEARYRSLFERVGDPMILLGPDGRYLDANPAASETLGYTRQEFRRMRVGDLVTEQSDWVRQQFDRAVQEGSWRGEAELQCKDGSLLLAEGQVQQVVLPGGNVYIAIWRDISRRRAVEDLQREFLESVSHDLQTPLTALSAAITLLDMSAGERLEPAEQELLANAERNAERLRHLIADLLAYNELKSGTLRLDREPVDLRIYSHVLPTMQADAALAMDRLMQGPAS
jgi:PAS domain S-box-containing protein